MSETPLHELVIHCPEELCELVTAWLFEAGAIGIEERTDPAPALVVYGASPTEVAGWADYVRQELAQARERTPLEGELVFAQREVAVAWEEEWLKHLRPVPLGEGFVAVPLGDETPLPQGRTPIVLRPSWAFGDGSHPTTQLAAEAVERAVGRRPGTECLDVGAGSGVLALVAVASGAARATLLDTDPKALVAARENAALNGLEARCEISEQTLAEVVGSYPLVVANINEGTLRALADDLARVTAPDGRLLLTGLVAGDTAAIEAALAPHGLAVVTTSELKDWVLLEFARGASRR